MPLVQYLKDTRVELKHVTWPSRRQTVTATLLVVAFSVFGALFLGFFDALFGAALQWLF